MPPVTQKSLRARLHSTWERARARIEKKMRVKRTQMKPKTALTTAEATTPPTRKSSMELTPQYFHIMATA